MEKGNGEGVDEGDHINFKVDHRYFGTSVFYSLPFYSCLLKLPNLTFFHIWSGSFFYMVEKRKKARKLRVENGGFLAGSSGRNSLPILMGLVLFCSERHSRGLVRRTFLNFDFA